MPAAAMRTEHVAETPRGWRVRTVKPGPASEHEVRIAFPPGKRKKGSGRVVEILHPASERNPKCSVSEKAKKNPAELLIFGNPSKRNAGGFGNHKPGCKCAFCKRAAKLTSKNSSKLDAQRAARARAGKIREARRHPLRNPKRSTPRKRRTDRRNPSDTEEAVRLFESFHGKDPKSIAEKHVSAAMRLDYAALGDLMKLIVITPLGDKAEFDFEGDGVKLASSPDGKQLYCIGGNQNIEKCLDADSLQKDFIDLGECVQVEYFARKVHANYEPVTYYHKLGEKTGDRPALMYDKLRKQIFFAGGAYFINKDKGISPGIEN